MRTVNHWPVEIRVLSIYSARPDYDNGASIKRARIDDNGNIRSIALELLEPIEPGNVNRLPKPKIGDDVPLPPGAVKVDGPKDAREQWVFVPGRLEREPNRWSPHFYGPVSALPLCQDFDDLFPVAPNQECELGAINVSLSPVAPRNTPIEPLAIVPALAPNQDSELGAINVTRPAPGKWIAAALVVPDCQGSIEYKAVKGRFYYYWRKSTAGFSGRRRESIYLGANWEKAIAKLAKLQNTAHLSEAPAPGAALLLSESVP
jgi:hypothetical protein